MDLIRKIVYLTNQIYDIYIKLYNLDISDKKDTSDYLSLINNLKEMIIKEKSLYKVLGNDKDSYLKLLNFASGLFDEDVCLRIYRYMLLNNCLVLGTGDLEKEIQLKDNEYKLYIARTKNMVLMQLSFIKEYIDSIAFASIRDRLIYIKYHSSFLNLCAEEYLVDYKFDVSKMPCVDFYLLSGMLNVSYENSSNYMLEGCLDMITIAMAKLFGISDNYYNYLSCVGNDEVVNHRKVDIIVSQCMLRAGLSLLNDSQYEKVEDSIIATLNLRSNNFNTISTGIVNSIIDRRKKDKAKVRTIYIMPVSN